ncbi:MAG: tetratricopeptide repeat protein [Deinococcales bacterium]
MGLSFVFAEGVGETTDEPESPSMTYAQEVLDAQALIDEEDYQGAIDLLMPYVESHLDDADAFNLLGYSNRKLGDYEKGLEYYTKALELEPEHIGANEYLGELYLETGELDKAIERLTILGDAEACQQSCEAYLELKELVDSYQPEGTSSQN